MMGERQVQQDALFYEFSLEPLGDDTRTIRHAGYVISRRIRTRIKEALYVARNGRRRWSSEAKRAIVAAGFAPGAVVRDVARQNDVTSSLIYRWRRELRAAANGFARVLMAPAGDGIGPPLPAPVIEIEFA